MSTHPCAVCGTPTDNGLAVISACDDHFDNPERAIGVLLECAGALVNLMEDRESARNLQFAEIALGRLRAMQFVGLAEIEAARPDRAESVRR